MPRRRWIALGVLSAVALMLHLAALGGLEWAWPEVASTPLPNRTVQVRVVDVPRAAPLPAAAPATLRGEPAPPAAPLAPVRAKALPARVRVATAAPAGAVAAPSPEPEAAASAAVPPAPLLAATTAAPPSTEPVAAEEDEAIPHYRTLMPPAVTLRYEVRRAALAGTGELRWRPAGGHYELGLEFKLSGLTILSQSSSGEFDAAGIAPLRFTDRRARRAATAANFRRDSGRISYSGASGDVALRPGAQDRLSWMLQLAAIVAAEPQHAQPGARIAMQVTGAHADAGVWVFRCVGPESVSARGTNIDAIKFVREPREAYDTTVQIWLDPMQHGLPVRATHKSGPNDEGYELRLLELLAPN